jgi:hypothetical protein
MKLFTLVSLVVALGLANPVMMDITKAYIGLAAIVTVVAVVLLSDLPAGHS